MIEEKMKEYTCKICAGEDLDIVYNELADVFDSIGMFQEQARALESLYHINNDYNLMQKIGDIMCEKLENFDAAYLAYDIYFRHSNSVFYDKFRKTLIQKGVDFVRKEINDCDRNNDLIKLVDRFCVIGSILFYFSKTQDFNTVLELSEKLQTAYNSIKNYIASNKFVKSDLDEIDSILSLLSKELSKVEHNEDITILALMYNDKNEDAYFRLIDELIQNGQEADAFEFYNTKYCQNFKGTLLEPIKKAEKISDVFWSAAKYYTTAGNHYKAVLYQKRAIDLELKENEDK